MAHLKMQIKYFARFTQNLTTVFTLQWRSQQKYICRSDQSDMLLLQQLQRVHLLGGIRLGRARDADVTRALGELQ